MNSYDLTYIATLGGFVYLAAITDTWSQRIVDYALVAPWPSDTGSRRLQPHDPTHTTSQNQVLQQPLGAQDQERPRQGPQTRPRRRQGRPPCHHECSQQAPRRLTRPPELDNTLLLTLPPPRRVLRLGTSRNFSVPVARRRPPRPFRARGDAVRQGRPRQPETPGRFSVAAGPRWPLRTPAAACRWREARRWWSRN